MNTPVTPITSPTTDTAPVSPATPAPEPASVPVVEPTSIPAVEPTPAPVSTPVPPTPVVTTKPPVSAPSPTPVAPPAAPQKKSNAPMYVAAALVLALTGGGLYFGSQYLGVSKDNRQQAYVAPESIQEEQLPAVAAPAIVDEAEAEAANPNIDIAVTRTVGDEDLDQLPSGTVEGKVCPIAGSTENSLAFYNLTLSTKRTFPVTASQTTYKYDVRPGKYKVVLWNSTQDKAVGHTLPSHQLKEVEVPVGGVATAIDVCDAQADVSSLPKEAVTGQ